MSHFQEHREGESPPAPESGTSGPAGSPPPESPQGGFEWGEGIDLKISDDRLTAWIALDEAVAGRYGPGDLKKYLQQHGVLHGIDEEGLRKAAESPSPGGKIPVARGTPAKPGTDGRVEWEVDLSILDGAKLREKGTRVDWKERHHILPVKENQRIARLVPPTKGTEGRDIFSQTLPAADGKEAKLPAGKNVKPNAGGTELFAAIAGVICREEGKIGVSPVYEVNHDVDLKVGNIDYEGSVVIKGNILPDFKVRCGRDLHVHGLVEGANLEVRGDIFIEGGIQGGGKSTIAAGGDIAVNFINNATVQARGDIRVQSAITQSNVRSHKSIYAVGAKGVVTGGRVTAEERLECGSIGSEMGAKTTVVLGEDIADLMREKKREETKLAALSQNGAKLQQAANQLNAMGEKGKLRPELENARLKIVRNLMLIKGKIKSCEDRVREIAAEAEALKAKIQGVFVRHTLWPGASITIMDDTLNVHGKAERVHIAYGQKKIAIVNLTDD